MCIYIYRYRYLCLSSAPFTTSNSQNTYSQTQTTSNTKTLSLSQRHKITAALLKLKPEVYMKQKFQSSVLLFLMISLLISSHITARALSMKQGEGEDKIDLAADEESLFKMETIDSLNKLMGLEECENGDKDCLNRRVLGEAHLDYIYTQQHKP